MAADTTLERSLSALLRSSRPMATAEAEHDVAAVVQRRPDDIGNVRPADRTVRPRARLMTARRPTSRKATIVAASTLSSSTAPAHAKIARICLSNVNHHGKIFPGVQCIERMTSGLSRRVKFTAKRCAENNDIFNLAYRV